MTSVTHFICTVAFAAAVSLTCAPSMADSAIRDLLLEAVKSKEGTASSEVTGQVADEIRAQIKRPGARVMANVSTLSLLPQAGCKRLLIRFSTPGTLLPTRDGDPAMLDLSVKLNVCPNGMPPGVDS